MTHALTLMRRRGPNDPGAAVFYFSLIAATGFALGWAAQVLGGV